MHFQSEYITIQTFPKAKTANKIFYETTEKYNCLTINLY